MKLLEFCKKYKYYIIAGVCIGLVLGLIFWFASRNNQKVEEVSITSINSPFEYQDNVITFAEDTINNVEIPSQLDVYKTVIPDFSVVNNFVKRFSQENPDIGENAYMWSLPGYTITYSVDTSLLFLYSEKGLVTDIKIGTKSDVKSFLLDYLGIEDIEISEVQELAKNKMEYKGYFVSDSIQYGSLYLDGYAIDMIADNSKIYSLSLLVLSSKDISKYQQMPTTTFTSTLSGNHERYENYISYDENYKKQYPLIQASSKLKSVDISSASYKYVFVSNEYKYIVPVFQMKGSGLLIDSQSNKYRADILVYTCALDPSYLYKVALPSKSAVFIDSAD